MKLRYPAEQLRALEYQSRSDRLPASPALAPALGVEAAAPGAAIVGAAGVGVCQEGARSKDEHQESGVDQEIHGAVAKILLGSHGFSSPRAAKLAGRTRSVRV